MKNSDNKDEIILVSSDLDTNTDDQEERFDMLVPSQNNVIEPESKVFTPEVLESLSRHGKYIRKSLLCPVCSRKDHIEINLMRARDHISLAEISRITGITEALLEKHFEKHYLISPQNQKLISLKEDTSAEAKEIVSKLLSGELDIYGSITAVLKGKAQRLNEIYSILNEYNARRDIDAISDLEIQEWVALNKLASEIEDSILKTAHIVDKKFTNLKNLEKSAVQEYELGILSKMVDSIQLVLKEIEKEGELEKQVIQKIRRRLADYFNAMEDRILKSSVILSEDNKNK